MATKKGIRKKKASIPSNRSPAHSVSVMVSPSAAGTASGAGTYEEGQEVHISFTSSEGDFEFLKWIGIDGTVHTGREFSFTMGNNDLTFMAICQVTKGSRLLIWED